MPVTNYYSVGGEILGEETSGVRRDYLTDALGSVTGTVTSTGAVENTYRYKPYGAQLSKTGIAADPAFAWVGKWGYRQTGKSYSDVYIRARHYSNILGIFNSKDKFFINIADDYYVYSGNNPTLFIDISGNVKITVDDGPHRASTSKYIDAFKRQNVKAIFFVQGRWVEMAIDLTKKIRDGGHIIGNHTQTHPRPFCYPPTGIVGLEEMVRQWCHCHYAVKNNVHVVMNKLRSPGGAGWLRCPDDVERGIRYARLLIPQPDYIEIKGAGADDRGPGGAPPNYMGISQCARRNEKCHPWKQWLSWIDAALSESTRLDNNLIFHDSTHPLNSSIYIEEIFEYIRRKGFRIENW